MLKTLKYAFAVKEIRNKILFTLGVLVVFRLGTYITVPGINAKALNSVASSGLISILNTFSGGGLTNYSILAMGVSPYIPLRSLFSYYKWTLFHDLLNGVNKVKSDGAS